MLTAIVVVFIIGYLAIAFEHKIHVNKAAPALLAGVLCWTLYIMGHPDKEVVSHELLAHLGEISGILFFLLGAMTLVELIDANDGFQLITERVRTNSIRKLLWMVAALTFFLSAALDNLTTAIVIVTMLRKLIDEREKRLLFAGVAVIAANSGGAWSPIGDVTTTMLWIGKQVTAVGVISHVFIPSVASLLVPLAVLSTRIRGTFTYPELEADSTPTPEAKRNFIFFFGLIIFVFVPVFKSITHLPPFMAMLLGLSVVWIVTEVMKRREDEEEHGITTVVHALRKIDSPSILFFLGILITIAALQVTGILAHLAILLTNVIGNDTAIVVLFGLLSAVVDNVPLVAAVQGMYTLEQYPQDSFFWHFLAYATGAGGSALIIGTAAGVAAMGIERIDFFWYVKKISVLALLGYFSGVLVFLLQRMLIG
jgi:Na+/H+ antiporter NhaD/arsenite permease-like protein